MEALTERKELALKKALGVDNIYEGDSYFLREYIENCREQGIDVDGMLPEKTYSQYEREFHMRNKMSEELEAKRANRDPFDNPHLVKEDFDMGEVIVRDTTLSFVSKAVYELKKATIRINNKQVWTDENTRTGDYTRMDIWNEDLESRYIYVIGSKESIRTNFAMKMGDETPIRVIKGDMTLTRDKRLVTIVIKGTFLVDEKKKKGTITRTYAVDRNIWLAQEIEKKDVKPEVVTDWTSEIA
jgi:hypothetical protein